MLTKNAGIFDETWEKLRKISKPFLTPREVSDILGRDRKTVISLCRKGEIAAVPKPYGKQTTYEITPQAVELYLSTQETLYQIQHAKKQISDHSTYVEDWKKAMRAGLIPGYSYSYSETTMANYARYMDYFFHEFQEVTPQNFQKILAKYPTNPDTRRHFYQTIVCFCKYLIGREALHPAILEEIQKNHRQKANRNPRRPVLTDEDLSKIIKACETSQELALVLLLASTGIRASECAALKLNDIDLKNQTITIRQAKWDKSRVLGLNHETVQMLQDYLNERPNVKCDYFFLSIFNQKMERAGVHKRIERLGRKAGVDASPHMFRRYFATSNLLKGRSIKEVQTALGHSTPDMTLKYDRTAREHVTEAMKNWQIDSSLLQLPHPPKSDNMNESS
jgi:integrase